MATLNINLQDISGVKTGFQNVKVRVEPTIKTATLDGMGTVIYGKFYDVSSETGTLSIDIFPTEELYLNPLYRITVTQSGSQVYSQTFYKGTGTETLAECLQNPLSGAEDAVRKPDTGPKGEKGDRGETGARGEQGVQGRYYIDIYQNSETIPGAPVGATINAETGVVTLPQGTEWTVDLTNTEPGENTYITRAVVDRAVHSGDFTPQWSAVFEAGGTGPAGADGQKGDKGDTGATGAPGADGADGRDGSDGADGKQGIYRIKLYHSGTTQPNAPTSVTHVVGTTTFTATGGGSDWFANPQNTPAGSRAYAIDFVVNPATESGTIDVTSRLSSVYPITGQQGVKGDKGDKGDDGSGASLAGITNSAANRGRWIARNLNNENFAFALPPMQWEGAHNTSRTYTYGNVVSSGKALYVYRPTTVSATSTNEDPATTAHWIKMIEEPTIPTIPARAGAFTQADEDKLDGIEEGATKGGSFPRVTEEVDGEDKTLTSADAGTFYFIDADGASRTMKLPAGGEDSHTFGFKKTDRGADKIVITDGNDAVVYELTVQHQAIIITWDGVTWSPINDLNRPLATEDRDAIDGLIAKTADLSAAETPNHYEYITDFSTEGAVGRWRATRWTSSDIVASASWNQRGEDTTTRGLGYVSLRVPKTANPAVYQVEFLTNNTQQGLTYLRLLDRYTPVDEGSVWSYYSIAVPSWVGFLGLRIASNAAHVGNTHFGGTLSIDKILTALGLGGFASTNRGKIIKRKNDDTGFEYADDETGGMGGLADNSVTLAKLSVAVRSILTRAGIVADDVPVPTSGDAGKFLKVNSSEDAYELTDAPSGGAASQFSPTVLYNGNLTFDSNNEEYVSIPLSGSNEWDDFDAIHISSQQRDDPLLQATLYKSDLERLTPLTAGQNWYQNNTLTAIFVVDQGGDGFAVGVAADRGTMLFATTRSAAANQTRPLVIRGLRFGGLKGDTGPKGDKGDKGDQGDTGPQGPQGPAGSGSGGTGTPATPKDLHTDATRPTYTARTWRDITLSSAPVETSALSILVWSDGDDAMTQRRMSAKTFLDMAAVSDPSTLKVNPNGSIYISRKSDTVISINLPSDNLFISITEQPGGGGGGDGSGTVGPRGPQGPQGPTGPAGPKGDKGDQGDTGPAGVNGQDGRDGTDGQDGATGPQGPTGPRGLQGEKGDTGDTGATGPQGQQGQQGPQGETGPAGRDGTDGTDGMDGATGPQGPAGADGRDGTDGATGPRGPKGDTGDTGATGPQGIQGPTGAAGADGAKGDKGDTGDTGPAGPAGPAGPQGEQGPVGDGTLDATQIGGELSITAGTVNGPSMANISDVFVLELEYTRTATNLHFTGLIRKQDIPTTGSYRHQLQGGGGAYITLDRTTVGGEATLRFTGSDIANYGSLRAKIFNLSAQGSPGEAGAGLRSGAGVPSVLSTDTTGSFYINLTNGDTYSFDGTSWIKGTLNLANATVASWATTSNTDRIPTAKAPITLPVFTGGTVTNGVLTGQVQAARTLRIVTRAQYDAITTKEAGVTYFVLQ